MILKDKIARINDGKIEIKLLNDGSIHQKAEY